MAPCGHLNLFQLYYADVVGSDKLHLLNWLSSNGLIPNSRTCECGQQMVLQKSEEFCAYFICRRKDLHSDNTLRIWSRFEGTIFEDDSVSPHAIMFMMLCRTSCYCVNKTYRESYKRKHGLYLDPPVITKYFKLFDEAVYRQIIKEGHFELDSSVFPIGGDSIKVELVLATFEKPLRMPPEEDYIACIFAMVECPTDRYRIAVFQSNNVDIEDLFEFVRYWVMPGSIVYTERAADYRTLDTRKEYHITNKFSSNFINWHEIKAQSLWNGPFTQCEAGNFCYYLHAKNRMHNGANHFEELVKILAMQRHQ